MKSKNLNSTYKVVSDVILELDKEFEKELDKIYEVLDSPRANEKIDTHTIDEEEKVKKDVRKESVHEPIENKIFCFTSCLFEGNGNERFRAKEQIKNSIEAIHVVSALKNGAGFMKSKPKVNNLLLFSPFWIRDPMLWPRNDGKTILEHLFVKDRIPWPFYYVWGERITQENMKWFIWFIILGQGGDLEAAGRLFGWNIEKGFSEHLLDDRIGFIGDDAIIESEIRRLGGKHHWHTNLLTRNPHFAIDPTTHNHDNSFIIFWYSTVKWLILNESSLDHRIYLKITKRAYEGFLKEGDSFTMEGKSVDQLIDKDV